MDTDQEEEDRIQKEAKANRPRNRDVRLPPAEKDKLQDGPSPDEEDTWELNEKFLIRHINTPRT